MTKEEVIKILDDLKTIVEKSDDKDLNKMSIEDMDKMVEQATYTTIEKLVNSLSEHGNLDDYYENRLTFDKSVIVLDDLRTMDADKVSTLIDHLDDCNLLNEYYERRLSEESDYIKKSEITFDDVKDNDDVVDDCYYSYLKDIHLRDAIYNALEHCKYN